LIGLYAFACGVICLNELAHGADKVPILLGVCGGGGYHESERQEMHCNRTAHGSSSWSTSGVEEMRFSTLRTC
jgi:hypothetical protein